MVHFLRKEWYSGQVNRQNSIREQDNKLTLNTRVQAKTNKQDYIKQKGFCPTKETSNKAKRQPTEWEKIFANHISTKRLLSKIKKKFTQLLPLCTTSWPRRAFSQGWPQLFSLSWYMFLSTQSLSWAPSRNGFLPPKPWLPSRVWKESRTPSRGRAWGSRGCHSPSVGLQGGRWESKFAMRTHSPSGNQLPNCWEMIHIFPWEDQRPSSKAALKGMGLKWIIKHLPQWPKPRFDLSRLLGPEGPLAAQPLPTHQPGAGLTLPLCNSALVTPGNSQLLSLPWGLCTCCSPYWNTIPSPPNQPG